MKQLLQALSIITIVIGIYITLHFLLEVKLDWLELDKTGQIGDFIGGVVGTIFSLSAFLLLALTLYEQTKFSKKEQFESKFFDLLKLHRENVLELENNNKNGRKELHDIYNQFLICREECKPFFNKKRETDIYNPNYLIKLKEKVKITAPTIDLFDCAKLDIPYIITFYGLSAQGKASIVDVFEHKYKKSFYERIINYMAMKPIEDSDFYPLWKRINNLTIAKKERVFTNIRELRNNHKFTHDNERLFKIAKDYQYGSEYVKFYGGHQYKLGHYFRHLFLTFTFINEQRILCCKEKYFYAKMLRAQLSTSEQSLLFINSLSSLGLVWDLNPKVKKSRVDFTYTKRIKSKRLITKYNLIKNLAGKEIFGIIYKDYYPEVNFEIDNLV